jgi:ubiquinone/menaquinone biosynthesis C-methylase UbiE
MSDHTKKAIHTFFDLIDKERNIYELAQLFHQIRKPLSEYINILQDPKTGKEIELKDNKLYGEQIYNGTNNIADFSNHDYNSEDWKKLNDQFLNYHKSLSVYTAVNCAPLINYLSLRTKIGLMKNIKVLDVGGGTGHTHCSFFQFPEEIEYYLLDPNLRLLHDQFLRLYPKLSYLPMGHIIANAEQLPIKDNSFDLVLNISAIDHMNDYKKFISESFRVLKTNGTILISSHLDIPQEIKDKTKVKHKIFSLSFWERVSRFLYFKKHQVGDDDHTLHLTNIDPIEKALISNGFKIVEKEVFKRYFWIIGSK